MLAIMPVKKDAGSSNYSGKLMPSKLLTKHSCRCRQMNLRLVLLLLKVIPKQEPSKSIDLEHQEETQAPARGFVKLSGQAFNGFSTEVKRAMEKSGIDNISTPLPKMVSLVKKQWMTCPKNCSLPFCQLLQNCFSLDCIRLPFNQTLSFKMR